MTKFFITGVIVATVLCALPCFPQGNTGIPFLMISPYTEANGMGEASVAVTTDDPLAVMTNPARLGALSRTTFLSGGMNYASWLPAFHLSDLWLRTYAVNAGINLKTLNKDALPLSFGIGHSRVLLNLGEFVRTNENSPEFTGKYTAFESSNQLSIGANLDYCISLSAGLTYKHVRSHISMLDGEFLNDGEGKTDLFDYGFLLTVPVVDIVTGMTHTSADIIHNLSPFADASIGVSKSNLGQQSMTYPDVPESVLLPRYVRAGIGLDLGAVYAADGLSWKPCAFTWTTESDNVLVGRDGQYKTGFGDIHFFDEVVAGHTNKETAKAKGWEVNLLEIVSVRGGRFEEDPERGNRRLTTSGWGVRSDGVQKLLRLLDASIEKEGVAGFLLTHVTVSYNACEWVTDDARAPLAGTKFDSVNLSIRN